MSTAALHSSFRPNPRDGSRGGVVGPAPHRPRLRLTRRGRLLFTILAAIPLVIAALAFALNGGGAIAGIEGSGQPLEVVTVQPGSSLWELAETLAPGADPRDVIHEIMQLNALSSPALFAGQQLDIPAAYSR